MTEITDAEKRELVGKVFPRLKKRARFIRFFKLGNAVLALLLMTACATTGDSPEYKQELQKQLRSMQIKQELSSEEIPSDFEKEMPHSEITLASVVKFSKEPTVKEVASNVIDLDYENGVLVLLKEDRLETNHIDCPQIALGEDDYISVRLENGLAVVTGRNRSYLLDTVLCGSIYETESTGKGFALSEQYMLEFTGNGYELYDSRRTRLLHSGSFLGAVQRGDVGGNSMMFANENGKIALMSTITGRFTAIYPEAVEIKDIYFDGSEIFLLNRDNELVKLTPDFEKGELYMSDKIQAQDGCFFLKRNGRLFCDQYVYGFDIAYKSPVDGTKGLIRDDLIFIVNEGTVSFVDVNLTYKKSVLFGGTGKKLCLSEGIAYFRDLDGTYKRISALGKETKTDSMPEDCDHRFDFDRGVLKTPDGKEIYRYADVVNSSDKALMMKRVIDGDIYYYFDLLD